MNGKVAKRLRKAAEFKPSAVRQYDKHKHTTHFPMMVRKPDGSLGQEWMPRVSFQYYCKGTRFNYLQSKLYYKLIRQGRIAHASSMYVKRVASAIKREENKLQDSESDGSKKEAIPHTDRPTNETRNQETHSQT